MGACGPPGASRCGVYPAKRGLVPRCALLPAPTPRDALSAVGTPSGRSLRNLECTGWAKPHQAGGRRGKEREARNEPTLRGVDYAATGGGGRSAPDPDGYIADNAGIAVVVTPHLGTVPIGQSEVRSNNIPAFFLTSSLPNLLLTVLAALL